MEGTLSEQLEAYAAAGREIFPAYGEAVDRLVARIHENGGGENAPRPGEAMPPFMLPDETGRLVSLKSLLAKGPVVVMFYRGHWCPYCRLNVRAVIQAMDRDQAHRAAQVVAIMPETQEYRREIQIRVRCAVPGADRSRQWLCAVAQSRDLARQPKSSACCHIRTCRNFHGNDGWVLPIPATFVVGRDGLVKARFVDPDFRKRMEIDDLLAALRSASEET